LKQDLKKNEVKMDNVMAEVLQVRLLDHIYALSAF